jgi:hypothetical protein
MRALRRSLLVSLVLALGAAAPPPAVLELKTEPPGAAVRIGGRAMGRTPLRLTLPPGSVTVQLSLAGHADEVFVARLEAGGVSTETRRMTPNSREPVSLVALSDPPGASVYLDDELLGTTDPGSGRLVKTGVAPGRHRVRFSLAGRGEVTQDVSVAASGPTTVRVGLVAASDSGSAGLAVAVAVAVLSLLGGTAWAWRRPAAKHRDETRTVSRPLPRDDRPLDLSPRLLVADPDDAPPRFGEYVLHEQLGRGGMATVFRAERGGESVALKRPRAALLEDAEFLERFGREAEIGRTLHHPNIVRILERGEAAGVPYFTMELVRGETLAQRLRERGRLSAREASGIIAQVAEALDYAHLKGVIHRDLKPSNIMVLGDGTAKVMDYGIARARRYEGLTATGAFLGTPDYVAPETAEGVGTDARSDLYALGAVFFEVLTGRKLFPADTPFAILRKHCSEPPPPPSGLAPDTPPEVEAMVLKLLAKSPADRYQSAEGLLIDLRGYLNRA